MKMNVKEHITALFIIAIIGFSFVTISGSVFSGYHFMDCSIYIQNKHELQEMGRWEYVLKHIKEEMGGRFRPAWHLNTIFSTWLLGYDLLMQGIWQIIENIIAAFLIYIIGRKLNWKLFESLLFAGLCLIGTQSAIFYQTLAIESTALVMLLLSWLSISEYVNRKEGRKRPIRLLLYFSFMLFSVLMSLMKENFILFLPATYVFYCMIYDEQYKTGLLTTLKQTWKTAVFLLVLCIAALSSVFLFAGYDFGYAGVDTSASVIPYLKCAIYLFAVTGAIFAFAGIIFLIWKRKKQLGYLVREWKYPVMLFAAITIPQIVLYAKSNIIDRYLIPASLGCAYLSVFIYHELKKENTSVSSPVLKNLAIIGGLALIFLLSLITFSDDFRQRLVEYAVSLQGKTLQEMTSQSSRQYLEISLRVNGLLWLAGGFMLLWGCLRKWQRITNVTKLYISVLLLFLLFNSAIAFQSHKRYAMRGNATEQLLHTIVNHTSKDDVILIAGNKITDGEGLWSISIWLNDNDRHNLYVCPLSPNGNSDSDDILLKRNYRFLNAIAEKESIRVIAIFPGMEETFTTANSWFNPSTYQRYEFLGNFVLYTKNNAIK